MPARAATESSVARARKEQPESSMIGGSLRTLLLMVAQGNRIRQGLIRQAPNRALGGPHALGRAAIP